uniref:Uncharacterized protein n=1 Tax=Romanomermis culicivorax TaxID=13658 RepID=A0A915JDX0_ROMCU
MSEKQNNKKLYRAQSYKCPPYTRGALWLITTTFHIPQASDYLTSRTCSATYLRIGIGPHSHSLHYGQDANWDE